MYPILERMRKFLIKYKVSFLLSVLLAILIVFASQASAISKPDWAGNSGQGQSATGGGTIGRGRLEGGKLAACQMHSRNITTRSNHMVDLANRMMQVFDSIAARVENYYLAKLVPQGKTLPNYNALAADIQTNKNTITPLLQALQTDIANFKCDGTNPGGQLTQFRTDMQAVIRGLKTYRTSIKNLIVAVASIRGAGDSNATGSATQPSITPTISPTIEPTVSQ